jgi:hypothetical protein
MKQSIETKIMRHLCNCKNHELDEDFTFYHYSQGFLVTAGNQDYRIILNGTRIKQVNPIPRNKMRQLRGLS